MKGYFAFPPPALVPSILAPSKTESIGTCTTWNNHDSSDVDQTTVEGEQHTRRERERVLGEHSEIEWVRAGGVLRDAFGRRDKTRTEQIRQELQVQDVEKKRLARWEAYETRWRTMQSSTTPIAFAAFPWPLADSVSMSSRDLNPLTRRAVSEFIFESLAVRTNTTTKKDRIRVSLLRWHPDKISSVLNRVVPNDLELVREGIHTVFSILKALQDAERIP